MLGSVDACMLVCVRTRMRAYTYAYACSVYIPSMNDGLGIVCWSCPVLDSKHTLASFSPHAMRLAVELQLTVCGVERQM